MKKHKDTEQDCNCKNECGCKDECKCENESTYQSECNCESDCHCGGDCNCDNCECDKDEQNCTCHEDKTKDHEQSDSESQSDSDAKSNDYLTDLMRLQAEFDNYRKRMQSALSDSRTDGFIDAIEQFLPALDSFKMATDMITDKNTLMGIKFIEKGILDTLRKMGVEPIDCTGKFDPELHQAIDTDNSADVELGMIVKEAYKGFTYKGKVIRYAQVIVKK